jgi:ATP-dependent Clp protease ATP-binding subunit ClpX
MIACSFCGLTAAEVKHLIKGKEEVYICDQCVDICIEIIADRAQKQTLE